MKNSSCTEYGRETLVDSPLAHLELPKRHVAIEDYEVSGKAFQTLERLAAIDDGGCIILTSTEPPAVSGHLPKLPGSGS